MLGSIRLTTPIALAAIALLLAGCVGGRNWNPFAEVAAPALPSEPSKEQVVAHLNANTERCTAWRSTSVSVKSNGFPVSPSAMMAVESPRRFRMLVTLMGTTDLADLGSNDERMWIWMRPPADEPAYIYTCAHCDLPAAQERLPFPFRPDWLMEVLGVIPIDPATVELAPNPGDAGQKFLISYETAPDGTQLERVMTVDLHRGTVVGHTLAAVSPGGRRLIAQAKLSDHQRDERTGVLLPHRIELSYPSADAEMTLTFKHIEVNPAGVAPTMWMPGNSANCPCRDLATGQIVTLDRAASL